MQFVQQQPPFVGHPIFIPDVSARASSESAVYSFFRCFRMFFFLIKQSHSHNDDDAAVNDNGSRQENKQIQERRIGGWCTFLFAYFSIKSRKNMQRLSSEKIEEFKLMTSQTFKTIFLSKFEQLPHASKLAALHFLKGLTDFYAKNTQNTITARHFSRRNNKTQNINPRCEIPRRESLFDPPCLSAGEQLAARL